MASERLAVVILTWNNAQYTLDCLQSLAAQSRSHTVYVVDNASADGTPERVAAAFPATRIIVNSENLGFSGGNNVGLRAAFAAGASAVLLLNNDTTLAPDALDRLMAAADINPDAGLLNPAILFAQAPDRVWFAGATLNPWTGWSYHIDNGTQYAALDRTIRTTRRSTGCALVITSACYRAIGSLYDDLFMYFEDVEYSMRARRAGFSVLLVPEAVVYHHISVSAGEKSPNTAYYGVRNAIVTMERHYRLPTLLQWVRRALIVIGQVYYVGKPPRGRGRLGDIYDGYRDALRHRMGKRGTMPRIYTPDAARVPSPSPSTVEEAI